MATIGQLVVSIKADTQTLARDVVRTNELLETISDKLDKIGQASARMAESMASSQSKVAASVQKTADTFQSAENASGRYVSGIQKAAKETSFFGDIAERTNNRIRFLIAQMLGMFVVIKLFRELAEAAKASLEYLGMIETSSLGIATAFMSNGQYIDATTGKILEGAEALKAAQVDAQDMLKQLQAANLQTIATLDQLIRAYQETLPVAMKQGFNRNQVKEFTLAMVQAAGAIDSTGRLMHQLGEETRSLLTGAIRQGQSRIAQVLGITPSDIHQLQGNSQALFDFLMKKLEAYRIAGVAAQTTWGGLVSNIKDISKMVGGELFGGAFVTIKELLKDISDYIYIVDEKTKQIKFNPDFVAAMTTLKKSFSDLWDILAAFPVGVFEYFRNLRNEMNATERQANSLQKTMGNKTGFEDLKNFLFELGSAIVFAGESFGSILAFILSDIVTFVKGAMASLTPLGNMITGIFTLDIDMVKAGLMAGIANVDDTVKQMETNWKAYTASTEMAFKKHNDRMAKYWSGGVVKPIEVPNADYVQNQQQSTEASAKYWRDLAAGKKAEIGALERDLKYYRDETDAIIRLRENQYKVGEIGITELEKYKREALDEGYRKSYDTIRAETALYKEYYDYLDNAEKARAKTGKVGMTGVPLIGGVNPDLLSAVVYAESRGNPMAVSSAGAKGLMQLMPETFKEMNVGEDIFDIGQNIAAGSKYLAKCLKDAGGNLDEALARYNWGPGNVEKLGMNRIPEETRKYIETVKKFLGQGDIKEVVPDTELGAALDKITKERKATADMLEDKELTIGLKYAVDTDTAGKERIKKDALAYADAAKSVAEGVVAVSQKKIQGAEDSSKAQLEIIETMYKRYEISDAEYANTSITVYKNLTAAKIAELQKQITIEEQTASNILSQKGIDEKKQEDILNDLTKFQTVKYGEMTRVVGEHANKVMEFQRKIPTSFTDGWEQGVNKFRRSLDNLEAMGKQFAEDFSSNLVSAIENWINGSEDAFENFGDFLKKWLYHQIALFAAEPILVSMKGVIGNITSGITNSLSTIFGNVAQYAAGGAAPGQYTQEEIINKLNKNEITGKQAYDYMTSSKSSELSLGSFSFLSSLSKDISSFGTSVKSFMTTPIFTTGATAFSGASLLPEFTSPALAIEEWPMAEAMAGYAPNAAGFAGQGPLTSLQNAGTPWYSGANITPLNALGLAGGAYGIYSGIQNRNPLQGAMGGAATMASVGSMLPEVGTALGPWGIIGGAVIGGLVSLLGKKERPPEMVISYEGMNYPRAEGMYKQDEYFGAVAKGETTGAWDIAGIRTDIRENAVVIGRQFSETTDNLKETMTLLGMDVTSFDKKLEILDIHLKGLSDEEVQAKIQEIFGTLVEGLSGIDFTDFAKSGEKVSDTIAAVMNAMLKFKSVVNPEQFIPTEANKESKFTNKTIWGTESGWDIASLWEESGKSVDTFTESMTKYQTEVEDTVEEMNLNISNTEKWRESMDELSASLTTVYDAVKTLVAGFRKLYDDIPVVFETIRTNITKSLSEQAAMAKDVSLLYSSATYSKAFGYAPAPPAVLQPGEEPQPPSQQEVQQQMIFTETELSTVGESLALYNEQIENQIKTFVKSNPIITDFIGHLEDWNKAIDDNNIEDATTAMQGMAEALSNLSDAAASMVSTALGLIKDIRLAGMTDEQKISYVNRGLAESWSNYEAARAIYYNAASSVEEKYRAAEQMTYYGKEYTGYVQTGMSITGAVPNAAVSTNLLMISQDGVDIEQNIQSISETIADILQTDILNAINSVELAVYSIGQAITGLDLTPLGIPAMNLPSEAQIIQMAGGTNTEAYKSLKDLESKGFKWDDLKAILGKGISIDAMVDLLNNGVNVTDLYTVLDKGVDPATLQFALDNGINIDDLAYLLDKGISVGELRTVLENGMDLGNLRSLLEAGLSVDELRTYVSQGVDIKEFPALLAGGINVENLRTLLAAGVSTDELKWVLEAGVDTGDLVAVMKSGFSTDELRGLVASGQLTGQVDVSALRSVLASGVNVADLKSTLATGLNVTTVQTLLGGGIDLKGMKSMLDAGISAKTINDAVSRGVDVGRLKDALANGVNVSELMDILSTPIKIEVTVNVNASGATATATSSNAAITTKSFAPAATQTPIATTIPAPATTPTGFYPTATSAPIQNTNVSIVNNAPAPVAANPASATSIEEFWNTWSSINPYSGFAKGGFFDKATHIPNMIVGEAGPEYILPEHRLTNIVTNSMKNGIESNAFNPVSNMSESVQGKSSIVNNITDNTSIDNSTTYTKADTFNNISSIAHNSPVANTDISKSADVYKNINNKESLNTTDNLIASFADKSVMANMTNNFASAPTSYDIAGDVNSSLTRPTGITTDISSVIAPQSSVLANQNNITESSAMSPLSNTESLVNNFATAPVNNVSDEVSNMASRTEKKINAFAEGGYFEGPTFMSNVLVGEAGPEFIVPDSKLSETVENSVNNVYGSKGVYENINKAESVNNNAANAKSINNTINNSQSFGDTYSTKNINTYNNITNKPESKVFSTYNENAPSSVLGGQAITNVLDNVSNAENISNRTEWTKVNGGDQTRVQNMPMQLSSTLNNVENISNRSEWSKPSILSTAINDARIESSLTTAFIDMGKVSTTIGGKENDLVTTLNNLTSNVNNKENIAQNVGGKVSNYDGGVTTQHALNEFLKGGTQPFSLTSNAGNKNLSSNLTNNFTADYMESLYNTEKSASNNQSITKVNAFAKGGYFNQPTYMSNMLVGEAGPEFILPESKLSNIVESSIQNASNSVDNATNVENVVDNSKTFGDTYNTIYNNDNSNMSNKAEWSKSSILSTAIDGKGNTTLYTRGKENNLVTTLNNIARSQFSNVNRKVGDIHGQMSNKMFNAYNLSSTADYGLSNLTNNFASAPVDNRTSDTKVNAFAEGGYFDSPTSISNVLIGEAGPEFILPESKLADTVSNSLQSILSANKTSTVHYNRSNTAENSTIANSISDIFNTVSNAITNSSNVESLNNKVNESPVNTTAVSDKTINNTAMTAYAPVSAENTSNLISNESLINSIENINAISNSKSVENSAKTVASLTENKTASSIENINTLANNETTANSAESNSDLVSSLTNNFTADYMAKVYEKNSSVSNMAVNKYASNVEANKSNYAYGIEDTHNSLYETANKSSNTKVNAFAEGGYFESPTNIDNMLVGEAGPEFIAPESKMREVMAQVVKESAELRETNNNTPVIAPSSTTVVEVHPDLNGMIKVKKRQIQATRDDFKRNRTKWEG